MARPRKPKEEIRDKRVAVRFTQEEFDQLQHEAGLAGLTVAEYVLSLTRKRNVKLTNKVVLDASHIQPAVRQLARVGNNLNQIAHWLNHHSRVDERFNDEAIETLLQVRRAVQKLTDLASGE